MQKGLLNISKRVTSVFHALGYIAVGGPYTSVKKMAKGLPVSATVLAKTLQLLVKAKYLGSMRGRTGGFYFIKDPHKISAYEIWTIIEGPLPRDACLFAHQYCKGGSCKLRELNAEVREMMEQSLRKTTLTELINYFASRES